MEGEQEPRALSTELSTFKMFWLYWKQRTKRLWEKYTPQSKEVFYPDHGEAENEPIEKVYVTTLVTPMGLASSFNGRISKIMVKK